MKNFFKKLSFVLAVAMVLTSLTPATASAASKNFVTLKGSKTAVTSVYAWIGGVTRNLDYNINGKTSGVKGTWKSSKEEFVKVDAKTGVITPVANGSAYVTFTTADGKTTVKTVVKARTRAAALHIYDKAEYAAGNKVQLENKEGVTPSAIELKVGETKDLRITMPLSKKQQEAGAKKASYFTYAEVKDDSFVTAEPVADGDERLYTLTAKAPGETTVTIVANQSTLANVRKNKYFREATINVNVVDGLTITDLTATKVNVLTATFASPVDTDDVTIAVTKGSNAVGATTTWNEDKTVATITTTAKMTVGTYTVTATSKTDASKKTEKTVEVQNQYVADIQILNDVALTGSIKVDDKDVDAMEAYVYYKVVDQYGEDLTASTSVQWSTSCGEPRKNDRSIGRLTLRRSDDKSFTYGEQLYVTGVYTRTGKSVSATLTVGAAQALHSIDLKGFVRKNSSDIVEILPTGFRSGEYYLLYDALDQNGNVMDKAKFTTSDITFISDNVLLIRELKVNAESVVINGHEYSAVMVEPGDYVDRGGEVNITAIAAKTGNTTKQNYVIGQNQILTSFTMSDPSGVTADGEIFAIPFVALDQNGENITNFTTLADNVNKLSFSVSEANAELKLVEQNDGTAVLQYRDKDVKWDEAIATDGVDRTVSLTSVIVGGSSDTHLLSISDKARPDAISKVKLDNAYLEGASETVALNKFAFLDQYGRAMGIGDGYGADNGFFNAASNGGITGGNEFRNYIFDIKMEYKGQAGVLTNSAISTAVTDSAIIGVAGGSSKQFEADRQTRTALNGNVFTFAIVKVKTDEKTDSTKWENVSPTYNHTFAVVDITQVRNFTVADFNKQYVKTAKSNDLTGTNGAVPLTISNITNAATGLEIPTNYQPEVQVKGSYNGNEVKVPGAYYMVEGNKLLATSGGAVTLGAIKINEASSGAISWSHLYDATTAQFVRKDTSDIVKATIYAIYDNDPNNMGVVLTAPAVRDAVSKNIVISDAAPVITTIIAPDSITLNPSHTRISDTNTTTTIITKNTENHYKNYIVEDQYGKAMVVDGTQIRMTFKVSKIEEAVAYADNNFTVLQNDSSTASIEGAERGDTYVLTITVTDGGRTLMKDITVTVGADAQAYMNQNANVYVDTLKGTATGVAPNGDGLEYQRQNTLK